MRAWLFQDTRQKEKLGEAKCPWSVGWFDPDGNKRSKRIGSKSMAVKYQRKIEGQLAAGTYQDTSRMSWAKFWDEWQEKIGETMLPQSRDCTVYAIKHFERIAKPKTVATIRTAMIDGYIVKRKQERGQKKGTKVSPATINRELRSIKAVLRVAMDWGYLAKVPKIRMLKEPQKLVRYVTPEHFAKMYASCKVATRPASADFTAGDWWKALLTFIYMTGWRISGTWAY